MTIVGGMSAQKQQRLLSKHPNIIVATPGRLWELFSEVYLINVLYNIFKHLVFFMLNYGLYYRMMRTLIVCDA